ncbi:MAG: hypothetical protein IPH07_36165 [Deltaproteobacteria bacterium]|nr:hypothetical protein [Deltaproteobacteria bacterium]MBK8235619.1 hypothetical protein [Deltaproteobacteria bacterium]MBK8713255.1 hypothetical protein [Deltaproteobacteria bacterium]MBP7288932.1 hypothetical protein [Nannocystaceae bacterium]
MALVLIFGPPAVGKMAVGLELERLTGLRLFHNHMAVDPVLQLFPFGSAPFQRLVGEFRHRVFEEVASSDLPGLIFTYVWALDDPKERDAIDRLTGIFGARGSPIHYVELEAEQSVRLHRNETPLRLQEKKSKRDLARSRARLLAGDAKHQLNTAGNFFYPDDHLKIDNTLLEPPAVAELIVRHFKVSRLRG